MGQRLTDEAKQYRAQVALEVAATSHPGFRGPVRLDVHYVLPDFRRRDMDNLDKQLRDALAGCWDDDTQITESHTTKCVERGEAWAVIVIESSTYDGTKWPFDAHQQWLLARGKK
jgi:Holliday junction resolvase RusA-like endonuclease